MNISHKPYELRLVDLNIQSLTKRRERGDLIQIFKIIKGIDDIKLDKGVNFNNSSVQQMKLRGHSYRMAREIVRNCPQRHNFLTNRVVNLWNKLPKTIENTESVNSFKNLLDVHVLV